MVYNFESLLGTEEMAEIGVVLAVYGVIFAFAAVIGLVFYIFQSIGLYKMAKTLGFAHPWMAWVPLLNTYTLGKIGSKYIKRDGRPSAKFGGWLLGLEIGLFAVVVALIVAVVMTVIGAIGMGTMGTDTPNSAFLGGVVSLILTYVGLMGIGIAYSVVYYIALWRMYAIFSESNATVFLVLSILFDFTTPFFIFAIRNNVPSFNRVPQVNYIPPVAPQHEAQETVNE